MFLDEVFQKNKELSKEYHSSQVELYLKYNKAKLMQLLLGTDAYSPQKAEELCKAYGMHIERAFLLIKLGNKEEAVKILIE